MKSHLTEVRDRRLKWWLKAPMAALLVSFSLIVALHREGGHAQGGTVNIYPGEDIPTIVSNNPAGTTFVIYPGLYRLQTPIDALDGDSFVGQTTCAPPTTPCPAILSGSELLTSFQYDGTYYYVTGQTQQGQVTIDSSKCEPLVPGYPTAYPGCIYPEDLYFDGVPLVHKAALRDVGTGSWYFDYTNHIIYLYDNPAGHTVETSVVPSAFAVGPANNLTIKYLTVEEFAAPILKGAIDGCVGAGCTTTGINWVIQNNEIMLNHGDGVRINFGWHVQNNYIHTNGNRGIDGGLGNGGTQPSGVIIQGNELAYNNYAHVSPKFGAGGAKLSNTYDVTFRGNNSHNNEGSGFHNDNQSYSTLYDNNISSDNTEQGIHHEISFNGTFRNNQLLRNGYIYPNKLQWMYGADLLSATSQNDHAYCNTVEVSAQGGNGINIIAQKHPNDIYVSQNNFFQYNTVVFDSGASGVTGGARGAGNDFCCMNFFRLNEFDYNTYHVPNLTNHWFAWDDKYNPWTQFQADGQEAHGSADTNTTGSIPTVTITSPADMSSVSGTVNVTGIAQDVNGLSEVDFYVDWSLQQTGGNTSPFSFAWNTSGATKARHTVAAMAYNTEGIRACYAEWLIVQ